MTPQPTLSSPADISSAPPAVKTTPILAKSLTLLLVAVLVFVFYRFTPLKDWLAPAGRGADWFRALGTRGIYLFIGAAAGLILLGIPRLLLCPLAGALYGFWPGLGYSLIATMISYYIGFLWIRGRRHKGLDAASLPKKLAFLAGDPGFTGVVLGRLLPVPGMVVTMALALSNVSDWAYILGSAIGLIPEAVPMVLAGIMPDSFQKWGKLAAVAMLCIAAGWLALRYFAKRHKPRVPAIPIISVGDLTIPATARAAQPGIHACRRD